MQTKLLYFFLSTLRPSSIYVIIYMHVCNHACVCMSEDENLCPLVSPYQPGLPPSVQICQSLSSAVPTACRFKSTNPRFRLRTRASLDPEKDRDEVANRPRVRGEWEPVHRPKLRGGKYPNTQRVPRMPLGLPTPKSCCVHSVLFGGVSYYQLPPPRSPPRHTVPEESFFFPVRGNPDPPGGGGSTWWLFSSVL